MRFERITVDPAVATGKPCIRHLGFPVSRLLGLLVARESRESILSAYPYLEEADIDEALHYPACLSEDETIERMRRRSWKIDMPLSPELAQWLRAEGHDAV